MACIRVHILSFMGSSYHLSEATQGRFMIAHGQREGEGGRGRERERERGEREREKEREREVSKELHYSTGKTRYEQLVECCSCTCVCV